MNSLLVVGLTLSILLCSVLSSKRETEVPERRRDPFGGKFASSQKENNIIVKDGQRRIRKHLVPPSHHKREAHKDNGMEELVDVRLERKDSKNIEMKFHSHGRLHELNLVETGQQLADVLYIFMGMPADEQAKVKESLKSIRMMTDVSRGASVAVHVDADGKIDPILHSGVFQLGDHEFHFKGESGEKARVTKRFVEKDESSYTDGMYADHLRKKRSPEYPTTIVPLETCVELTIILDHSIYRDFGYDAFEAIAYFGHIVSMMDISYASMQNADISTRVTLTGVLLLAMEDDLSFLTEDGKITAGGVNYTNGPAALNSLTAWLGTNSSDFLRPYDHVMLFTRNNIYYDDYTSPGLLGLAWIATICNQAYASSLVESLGTISYVAVTATHELGHGLGAAHDGVPGFSFQCPDENYIMASYAGNPNNLENKFQFSCCSQRSFYALAYISECLFEKTAELDAFSANVLETAVYNQLPGKRYKADDQCYIAYGTEACAQQVDICLALQCVDPRNSSRCVSDLSAAADGTKCAPKSWCMQGKCILKTDSYTVPDLNCSVSDCYGFERRCKYGYNKFEPRVFCYTNGWYCDGWLDCTCGSDEENCYQPCPQGYSKCENGYNVNLGHQDYTCIPDNYICDGIQDCSDNSDELNCKAPFCGGRQEGNAGGMTSPYFPYNYPDSTTCVWEIVAPAGKVIDFTFLGDSMIESDNLTCSFDHLSFYNLSPFLLLGKKCGLTYHGTQITSQSNTAIVFFQTDAFVNFPGWRVIWSARCRYGRDRVLTYDCLAGAVVECSRVRLRECNACPQVRMDCCNQCCALEQRGE